MRIMRAPLFAQNTTQKQIQTAVFASAVVHRLVASPQSKQNSNEHSDNTNFDRGAGAALVALRNFAARCFDERGVNLSMCERR